MSERFRVIAIILLIAVMVYYLASVYFPQTVSQLVPVTSKVDNDRYFVLEGPEKERTADLLATVKKQAEHVAESVMKEKDKLPEQLKRSTEKLPGMIPLSLFELDPNKENTVAYNLGKGQAIFLCAKNGSRPADSDVLLSVLLHEMAHGMEADFAPLKNGHSVHSKSFKDKEQLLMQKASELGYLSPTDVVGRSFCRITIPDPRTAQ